MNTQFISSKKYSAEEIYNTIKPVEDFKISVAAKKVENFEDIINYLISLYYYFYKDEKNQQALDRLTDIDNIEIIGTKEEFTINIKYKYFVRHITSYNWKETYVSTYSALVTLTNKMIDEYLLGEPNKKLYKKAKEIQKKYNIKFNDYKKIQKEIEKLQKEINRKNKELNNIKELFNEMNLDIDDNTPENKIKFEQAKENKLNESIQLIDKYNNLIGKN